MTDGLFNVIFLCLKNVGKWTFHKQHWDTIFAHFWTGQGHEIVGLADLYLSSQSKGIFQFLCPFTALLGRWEDKDYKSFPGGLWASKGEDLSLDRSSAGSFTKFAGLQPKYTVYGLYNT